MAYARVVPLAFLFALAVVSEKTHALAVATASYSNITCSFTNSAGVTSVSYGDPFDIFFIGPLDPVHTYGGWSNVWSGCSASLLDGASLSLTVDVELSAYDEGFFGAAGGTVEFPLPFASPHYAPQIVPSGHEYAHARSFVGFWFEPRYASFPDGFSTWPDFASIATTQDKFADFVKLTGTLSAHAINADSFRGVDVSFGIHTDLYAQSVPEPETYALLIAGLLLLGLMHRRRRYT